MTFKISQKDVWSEAGERWITQELDDLSSTEKIDLIKATVASLKATDSAAYQQIIADISWEY